MKFSLNLASNMVNPEGHAIELRCLVIMINKWNIKYSNVWDYLSTYLYIIYITITQKHLRCQQILFYGTQYLWYAYFMSNHFCIWFLKVQKTKKILKFSCNYPSNMAVFINGLNAWKSFFALIWMSLVWFQRSNLHTSQTVQFNGRHRRSVCSSAVKYKDLWATVRVLYTQHLRYSRTSHKH